MKVLLVALAFLLHFTLHAQVTMKDGKVIVDKILLCHYLEGEKKANELKHHVNEQFSRVSEDFRDVYFTSPHDNFLAVAMEAKVLAHSRLAYITNYYSIKFFSTGDVINVAYKPLRIDAFIKDLAQFDIFKEGMYHPEKLPALLAKWKAKDGVIADELINTGVTKAYVQQGTEAIQDSLVANIFLKNGDIYRGDILIARYKEGRPLDPRVKGAVRPKTYYIQNLKGENMMILTVPQLRSVVFALHVPSNQEFSMITPDKTETRLIRAATGFLMLLEDI